MSIPDLILGLLGIILFLIIPASLYWLYTFLFRQESLIMIIFAIGIGAVLILLGFGLGNLACEISWNGIGSLFAGPFAGPGKFSWGNSPTIEDYITSGFFGFIWIPVGLFATFRGIIRVIGRNNHVHR